MPTYDYKCDNCNYQYTSFEPIKKPHRKCPKCNKNQAKRYIKPGISTPIHFKGNGFYCTDYK